MKENMLKISNVLKNIFGYGIMITLFAGGFTFFGYLIALIFGGQTAELICTIIYKKIIPVIIYVTTNLIVLGLVSMYLANEKALIPSNNKNRIK